MFGKASPQPEKFRDDIEGLRGVAVLLVVAFHSGLEIFRGGFVGVDVFFVISGYLITGLLYGEIETTGRLDFLVFYARRGRRLVPAAVLTITVVTIGSCVLLSPYQAKEVSKAALTALLFCSNVWFIEESTDYFFGAGTTHNPLLHTWSLGVEEQFYLVWPLLIFLASRWRTAQCGRSPILLIALLSAISFAACVAVTLMNQPVAFFAMPTRAWQFGVGALSYLLPWRSYLRPTFTIWLGLIGCGAILAASMLFTSDGSAFPGAIAAIPTLGSAAILISGEIRPRSGSSWLLSLPVFYGVGRISYSWYLWHWPALVVAGTVSRDPGWRELAAAVLASLILSILTHVLVENPVRFSRYLRRRIAASLGLGAGLTAASIVCSFGAYTFSKQVLASPEQREILAAADVPQRYIDCVVRATETSVRECSFGNVQSSYKLVLFGDSHAMQWLPPLEGIAAKYGVQLVTVNKTGCPAVRVPTYAETLKRGYFECDVWRADAMRRIVELHPKLVITSNYSSDYLKPFPDGRSAVTLQTWSTRTRELFEQLFEAGIPAVMIRDTPIPGRDIVECLSRAAWHGAGQDECSVSRFEALNEHIFEAERASVSGLKFVRILDFSDQICGPDACPPAIGGTPVYRDSHHLSRPFVMTLAPVLERALLLEGTFHAGGGEAPDVVRH